MRWIFAPYERALDMVVPASVYSVEFLATPERPILLSGLAAGVVGFCGYGWGGHLLSHLCVCGPIVGLQQCEDCVN